MPHGKRIVLRLQIAFFATAFLAAWLFSIEPARDFFIESTLERHYDELETFRKATATLRATRLTEPQLREVLGSLTDLENKGFLLEEDSKLARSQAIQRLGDNRGAEAILNKLLQSKDEIVRADAVVRLADLAEKQDLPIKGAKLLEKNRSLFQHYRRDEILFTLARLWWQAEDFDKAGKAVSSIVHMSDDEDDREFYKQVVKARWSTFARAEKRRVLDALLEMSYYGTASELTARFIREENPDAVEAERISFALLYRTRDAGVKLALAALSENTNLTRVAEEMTDFNESGAGGIRSSSGYVRGAWFYRQLRGLNRSGRYNADAAAKRFREYLAGDVDQEYLKKNLMLSMRAQLAVKDYAAVTNLAISAFARAGRTNMPEALGAECAFWCGYAAWKLGDGNLAVEAFESSLSLRPVSYHAMQARDIVSDIFTRGLASNTAPNFDAYVRSLEEKFLLGGDIASRLHYGRALYAFRSGSAREALGERIAGLLRNYHGGELYDFDGSVLAKVRKSPNYVKFLIYARAGFHDRAKALLASAGIQDPLIQDILLLREMVKNRQYQRAQDIFSSIELSDEVVNVLPFLSPELRRCIFPTPFDGEIGLALSKLHDRKVDRFLVYSIIRAESFYMPNLRSSAGARGLMQLMPATARLIARDVLGQREVNLYDPVNNIMLGTRYINDTVQELGLVSGVACYNGGIAVISRMKKRFSPANALEMAEILPYAETREYVKKVLTYYAYYTMIYQREELAAKAGFMAKKEG